MNLKGLIYCRVSSIKQVKEGNGLSSQEKRCRDYAINTLGIQCEKVFNDEGVSGGLFKRKSIQELLKYIDNNKNNNYTVIFEDLNRLSRDIQVHTLLRNEFRKRGVELSCPNFQFDETPEGDFKENISVVVSQYERKKNKQRVLDRQRARLEQGFWCFRVPLGFKYTKAPNGGKIIIQAEIISKKIKYAFEKYANNEISSLGDLLIYLNNKGLKIKGLGKNNKILSLSSIYGMITNPLYTGYLEVKKWNIPLIKAQHKGIISLKTFKKIQEKLISKSQRKRQIENNTNRADISNDFPLRGFLHCEKTKGMFSGSWSQGKKSKFPYYTFPKKSSLSGKSINRDKLHKKFEILLKNIQPKEKIISAFEKAVELVSKNNKKNDINIKESLKIELKEIDIKINNYITRIGKTKSDSLISNYENKIEELEKEKTIISGKINQETKNVGTPLKRKTKLVRNSLSIWKRSDLDNKKALLKNIFPEGIPINEKRDVGTPKLSLIYQAFSIGKSSISNMVELDGFEPTS